MRTLHLFAGAGGGLLADILLGHRIVCAVEFNEFCQGILKQRQIDGCLPWFPIWNDVTTFDGKPWRGLVDCVAGGFPCQPYSSSGKRRGSEDKRNLWPETLRIIREVGPSFAFLENVPGLLSFDYFGEILGDLGEAGYDTEWETLSAAQVGADHVRKRLWIFAWDRSKISTNTNSDLFFILDKCSKNTQRRIQDGDNSCFGLASFSGFLAPEKWWRKGQSINAQPFLVRNDDGVAGRLDRLKAIGNGQVPQVAAFAFLMLAAKAGIDLRKYSC
jgi:DNA (cytosine-5)-methyltransferase 1